MTITQIEGQIPGMPPGGGQSVVPHAATFIAMMPGGVARVFRPSDEALKESRENARFMRADAAVMECVELRQRAVALLDWRVACDDPADQPVADLVTRILQRIPRFVQYRENLLSAIWYGRYAVENVFQWDWLEGTKVVRIAGWTPIHGDKLVWRISAKTGRWDEAFGIRVGNLSGLSEEIRAWFEANRRWIEPTDLGLGYFPPPGKRELLVVHRHQIEDGEYEESRNADRVFGVGIRSRIYWVWYQKQQALRWLMEFLERSAFGIELWYYPSGNLEARQEMLRAAQERVGTGKNILLVPRPPGGEGMVYGVERIEPSMAGAEALRQILADYFGHQIKRYILGQTLTTEAQATGLGSNLASIHQDTFLQIVRYDAGNLEETLTDQLVRRLVHWNWPGVDPGRFRFEIDVRSPDAMQRLEAVRAAFDMGLKVRPGDLAEMVGLAQPGPGEQFLQNPAYRSVEQGAGAGEQATGSAALRAPLQAAGAERYSTQDEGPREGQRRTSAAGSQQVFHEHRWHNVPEHESAGFISPNVGPAMSIPEARRRLRSQEHHRVKHLFIDIARREGLEPKQALDAIGMWLGGAENSILLEFGPVPWTKLLVAAARMGLEARQEGVAVFQEDGQGVYGRWTATFTGRAEDLAAPLVDHGVKNWTVLESKGGIAVVVCDEWDSLTASVPRLVDALGGPVSSAITKGRFELISGDTRTEAAWKFRAIIDRGRQERQRMAAKEDKPWFLRDLTNASSKVRAWAEIMRRGYEAEQLSPEERERRYQEGAERCRQAGIEVREPRMGHSTVEGAGQSGEAATDEA